MTTTFVIFCKCGKLHWMHSILCSVKIRSDWKYLNSNDLYDYMLKRDMLNSNNIEMDHWRCVRYYCYRDWWLLKLESSLVWICCIKHCTKNRRRKLEFSIKPEGRGEFTLALAQTYLVKYVNLKLLNVADTVTFRLGHKILFKSNVLFDFVQLSAAPSQIYHSSMACEQFSLSTSQSFRIHEHESQISAVENLINENWNTDKNNTNERNKFISLVIRGISKEYT